MPFDTAIPTKPEKTMFDAAKPATKDQRNYALRRIVYNTMIAAKALDVVPLSGSDYSQKELAKAAGLIMARNLDDYFFKQDRVVKRAVANGKTPNRQNAYTKPDDIFVSDFSLSWTPPPAAMIDETAYERINKLVGHIVAEPPDPFKDPEALAIIEPLVLTAIEFVQNTLAAAKASYTGKAGYYVRRLNGTLRKLGMATLPKPT